MDLDELKERTKNIKAPAANSSEGHTIPATLIAELKEADEKRYKSLRKARTFFIIATGIFLFAFVAALSSFDVPSRDVETLVRQRGSILLIYLFVSVLYFLTVRRLSRIDYTEPMRQFLRNAERRYMFMSPGGAVVMVAGLIFVVVIAEIGYVPYLSRKFGTPTESTAIGFALFIIAVAVMGTYFTWKDWRKDRAQIWRQIKKIREELENDYPLAK